MNLSIFLAQIMGLYFLIGGFLVLLKKDSLVNIIKSLSNNRLMILFIAALELFAGLAIFIAHPVYTVDWNGLITLIGIWMVIESIFFLAIPGKMAKKWMKQFNSPTWYSIGGLLAIGVGAYLAGSGFGII